MLVLSRHQDEEVVINPGPDQIVVTVLAIRGDKVRLGFDAPAAIEVHRREVAEAIARDRALGMEGGSPGRR